MRKGQPERMSEMQKIIIAYLQKQTRKPTDSLHVYGGKRKELDYYDVKSTVMNNYSKTFNKVSLSNCLRNLQKKGYIELFFTDNEQKIAQRYMKCEKQPIENNFGFEICENCPMKKKNYRGLCDSCRVHEEERCYFFIVTSDGRWNDHKHHVNKVTLTDKGWDFKVEMDIKEDTSYLKLIS